MTQVDSSDKKQRLPPQGLMIQLIAIILLPLTLILLVVTFGSVAVHQNAMRTMVGERDERAVNTAASAISAQLDLRMRELNGLAHSLAASNVGAGFESSVPVQFIGNDFDRGIAAFDVGGSLLATLDGAQFWNQYLEESRIPAADSEQLFSEPGNLVVVDSPIDHTPLGLISYPVSDSIQVVGAFTIKNMVENTLKDILPASSQQSVLLVGDGRQVLYRTGGTEDFSGDHAGVDEGLNGKSGTVFVRHSGNEHVTAYSPVAPAGWALVTEESWAEVSTPALRSSQLAPLVLVPAILVMSVALWFAARQIIQPLRVLEGNAAKLAEGDFATIRNPVGGIAEIQHLQAELVELARKVQEAQRSLHGYIGSITAAQEEERRRLARELHDDTLQALIALKQRVQLAQLRLAPSQSTPESGNTGLDEIATLTEETIQNLRRLTRDLRPIYLEDLGLVPALEMLTREASQVMGIPVSFQNLGSERRLETNQELALYRIAQEALNNISRHAHANQASLTIEYSAEAVRLRVTDDGVGFRLPPNQSEFTSKGHYGLLGLYERAELIGATLEINTHLGEGTNLTVTLPSELHL